MILHLPDEVRLVSLSATVSNAEEFGGWIQTVRGDTTVVVDEHRPVPLWQHVLVGKRLFDLFDYSADKGGTGKQHLVDPTLLRHIANRREADRLADWQPRHRGRGDPTSGGPALFGACTARRRGPTSSPRWTGRACCRRSPSSSPAPAARPPSSSACAAHCGSPPTRTATASPR